MAGQRVVSMAEHWERWMAAWKVELMAVDWAARWGFHWVEHWADEMAASRADLSVDQRADETAARLGRSRAVRTAA